MHVNQWAIWYVFSDPVDPEYPREQLDVSSWLDMSSWAEGSLFWDRFELELVALFVILEHFFSFREEYF